MRASLLWGIARLLAASATLSGCGDDEGEATGSTCPEASSLTYESFGQDFFQKNCLACHGANGPESPKLDTLAKIRESSALIDKVAAAGPNSVNTVMPEGGSVDTAEREKLGQWLACGAPE
jgi:mono/diheme cytochrome c family protein